jgi:hypothetical protein
MLSVFYALIAFVLHVALVLVVLQFVETQWPTLARWVKAVFITTLVALVLGLLRHWVCGWLC